MDVSIIITTYNYATYIRGCIESCLAQPNTHLDYEIIVVDDGSTDETPQILATMNHSRLRKFRIENSGIEGASNFGFHKATGHYVVRVDADDCLLPTYLHQMQMHLNDKYEFYYADYFVIDVEGQITNEMDLPKFSVEEIHSRGDFLATGTIYSNKLLAKFNYYSEEIRNSGLENYELILRLLNDGVIGKHIGQKLFCYRRHSLNISASQQDRILRNGKDLFLSMGLGTYCTNEYHPYMTQGQNS